MKMGTLYRLDFSSGKSYIGVTVRAISDRVRAHACAAKDGSLCLVHQAWRKHGAPTMIVLSRHRGRGLFRAEIKAISKHCTMAPNGYNMTPGGDISPRLVPEIAARMCGRRVSEETRAKMSASLKGRVFSDETRARISAGRRGIFPSEETRKRMSVSMLNNTNARRQQGE